MKLYGTMGIGFAALLLVSGCAHRVRVNSVNLAESGTYVVATPGALTIAQRSANASRTCTLHTGGAARGKHGKHGERGGRGGPGGAGSAAMTLDTLLFRLCEARANNDITPAQYAASVQQVLKTMSKMAARRPPPRPGMRGPWGPDRMRRGQGPGRDGGPNFFERRDRGRRPPEGARPGGPTGPGARPDKGAGKAPGDKGNKRRQRR